MSQWTWCRPLHQSPGQNGLEDSAALNRWRRKAANRNWTDWCLRRRPPRNPSFSGYWWWARTEWRPPSRWGRPLRDLPKPHCCTKRDSRLVDDLHSVAAAAVGPSWKWKLCTTKRGSYSRLSGAKRSEPFIIGSPLLSNLPWNTVGDVVSMVILSGMRRKLRGQFYSTT